MKMGREIRLLFWRKMMETIREPAWVIAGLSTPLLYLALFTLLLKGLNSPLFSSGKALDVFVPGILALMAFGAGMGSGWTVIWELQSGVIGQPRADHERNWQPCRCRYQPAITDHFARRRAASTFNGAGLVEGYRPF